MRGKYTGQQYRAGMIPAEGWKGGVYVDERGVSWMVTPDDPHAGETTFTAQSQEDADARRYESGDWSTVFDQVDAYAAGAGRRSGLGGLLLLVALLWALDKRRG